MILLRILAEKGNLCVFYCICSTNTLIFHLSGVKHMRNCYLIFILIMWGHSLIGQGIRGKVYTDEKEPLPYATIYIQQKETGASTNEAGVYELKLAPGTYELIFQHLGYQTVVRQVNIGHEMQEMDVTMPLQAVQLKEIEVRAGKEDPAYTIIRKAIAKSKFHTLQVQQYTAQVYTKGAGRVKDMPFLLRKALEDEDIDSSTVYLTESVSEVTFEQPNTVKERVISIRSVGEDNQTSPNNYINGSFYKPEVAGAVSPLSPRAFAYYRFRFLGSFYDRGQEVNKIQVIPRSRGDNVFSGYLYIINDQWSIHSLNLRTYKSGFQFDVRQIYNPVVEGVWMPVSHKIDIEGKILGVELEYKYLATVSQYDIVLNPDLPPDIVVVDEKIEKELAKALIQEEKQNNTLDSGVVLAADQKLTRKELRKTLKQYEKELEKQEDEPEVIRNTSMTIDSTAYQQDSAYWQHIRPVPLTDMEVRSYQKLDSIALVESDSSQGQDNNSSQKGKGLAGVLTGTSFKLGKNTSLEYQSLLLHSGFNTVEGWYIGVPLIFQQKLGHDRVLELSPQGRYEFARKNLLAKVGATYFYHTQKQQQSLKLEGGRYVSQLNANEPIDPMVNTFYTLFYRQNYLKLYEKKYVQLTWDHRFGDAFSVNAQVEWAERYQLSNNTTYSFSRSPEAYPFTPNAPANMELEDSRFPTHQAMLASLDLEYRPFLQYRVHDGKKEMIRRSSPALLLSYHKGISGVLGSDTDFDQVELGIRDQVKVGVRGRLDYLAYVGSFLNRQQLFFIDYQHFMGNRTVLQVADPVGSFRLLDYYRYSTAQNYAAAHLYYQFRKFLLTQIFEVRLLGLKENLVFNYLKTSQSPHYMEVGYSLDNILRFLRLEVIAGFENGNYQGMGFRVGISADLNNFVSF